MNFHTLKIVCFSIVPCLLFLPTEVWAATKTWNSTTSTNWFTAGNWTGGVPGSGDTAVINLGASGPIVNATGAVANIVEVGTTATGGTLGIQSGGGLTDASGWIGYNAGSSGTATVSGSNSNWTNTTGLRVGSSGNGTLNVQSGGTVNTAAGYIGYAVGSSGTATVTGSGSSLTDSGTLYVGDNGSGTLNVESGATVSNTIGYIGYSTSSSGTATVTGSGSSWSSSTNLYVGDSGNGTLSIQSSGNVSDAIGYVGYAAGGSGTATVNGSGSSWNNSSNLDVGYNGNGTLNIQNGGAVSNAAGYIGNGSGTTGSATVSGAGSSWTNSGYLYVGYSGSGSLTVESGASVSNTNGNIGQNAGSSGTATIEGAGSSWDNSGTFNVGNNGVGTLYIQSGATVSDTNGNIGTNAGSTGTATVDGAGSSWTNNLNTFFVGKYGTGTLYVQNGGSVIDPAGEIGVYSGSIGTATVTGAGSSWTSSGILDVGTNGNGTLNIENGGSVSDAAGYIADGAVGPGVGVANVSGSGSTWINNGSLLIGQGGNGTLNIGAGGTVSNTIGAVGNGGSATGTANINGSGALWESSEYLIVASAGQGTLNITGGGTVDSTGVVGTGFPGLDLIGGVIGNTEGAAGAATVSGSGSAWNIDGGFLVGGGNDGNEGQGTLTISNGGAVTDTSAFVGHNAGSTGSAAVSGNGTTWSNSGDLYIGENGGNGTLTISSGALVTTESGTVYNNNSTMQTSTSTVYIADTPGSVGTLNIGAPAGQAAAAPGTLTANTVAFGQGNGTLVFNHTSQNYVFAPVISGNGTIDVLSGTTILSGGFNDFTGNIYMAPNAALTTTDSQEASTEKLGSDMRALAIESRSTANELLGLTRPVDDRNYLFYGAMFGSAVVYGGGQHSADGVTVLGGIAQGTQEYPGIRADAAPTVAGAVRYTFDDPFGDEGNALQPYAEIGGWTAPSTGLTITRIYANGSGLAMGEGDTDAISWAEYGRGGLVWNATKDDRFAGYVELGQQYINFNGYTENSGADNPFPATIGAGLFRMDVVRAGGSWTRDLQDLIGVPWSITLAGDAARSFDVHSGLTATVGGVGGMNASNEGDTWGEFGAKLETRISENASFYADLSGTTGGSGIGTVLHAGAGLSYSF